MKALLTSIFFLVIGITTYGQSPYNHHVYEKVATPDMGEIIEFVDMNNDGYENLVNLTGNNHARIYHSNGSGIDKLDYTEVHYEENCLIVDWNNDNLPDILSNWSSLKLIKNTGNFTFAPPEEISSSSNYGVDTADINGDGYIDAFSTSSSVINLYINQSGGLVTSNYSIATSLHTYNNDMEVRFNDIENDGLKEMFVKAQEQDNKVYIYTQTGSMDYTLHDSIVSNSIGSEVGSAMYFEDLNNNGHNELIIRDGWFVRVFEWTSGYNYNLVFSGNAAYTVNSGIGTAALVEISDFYDVDHNGYLDIVVGNSVFFNNGNFSFNEVAINATPRLFYARSRCTDFDNDGKTDICYVSLALSQSFCRTVNTTGQILGPNSVIWYFWNSGVSSSSVLDFDNDGDADVVTYNTGKMILWENINDTLYPKKIGGGLSIYNDYIDVVDINQDSYIDLIWSSSMLYASGKKGYRLNNNGSDFNSGAPFSTSNMQLKLIEDIDGDGIEELFYYLSSGVNNYIYMYKLNTGVPILAATVLQWSDYNVEDVVIKLADYDLDGLKDVFIQSENSGYNKIRIGHNDGSNTFSAGQIVSEGSCEELLGVFDIDGDQYPDLFWHNGSTQIRRNKNNGGTFGSSQLVYLPYGSLSGASGFSTDFDNDGLTDLIVQSDSKQWILRNTGYGLSLIHSEPTTDKISRLLDVDNDGDLDLIAYDTWYENIATSTYFTSGTVYYDVNANGVFDQGTDILFPMFPVKLDYNSLTVYTDTAGYFNMPLGSTDGNFNLSIGSTFMAQFNATTTPYPSVATVNSGYLEDSVSIGVTNINNIVDGTLDVTLSGNRCNDPGRLYLQVQNLSPENVDLEVKVTLAENTLFTSSSLPVTQVGDTLIWNFTGVDPMEVKHFYADISMPGTSFQGDTMHFYSSANFTGNLGTQLLKDTLNQIITCAYDPNDKNITMTDFVYYGDTTYSFKDETEYLIRFQNTGNDTATNIMIRDQLSHLFDWSTVRPISASNSFNFTIDANGLIEVKFNNINLPDSSANFLGSMGYIKFKVDYASTSSTFVPVKNYAMIYFDQNPPIYTNMNEFFRVDCMDFINIPSESTDNRCFVDSLTITNYDYGLPFNYEWTKGTYIDNTEDEVSLAFDTMGLKNYSIKISGFGCSADSTIDIELYPFPNIILSFADTSICPNELMTITSNQPVNWNTNGTDWYGSPKISLTTSSSNTDIDITASLTNSYGCSDTAIANVEIILGPPSFHSLDFTTQDDIEICLQDSIVVNSNYDSLIWHVDYINEQLTDFNDTSKVLTIPADSTVSKIVLEATINYLGCNLTHIHNIHLLGPTNNSLYAKHFLWDRNFQAEDTNYYCQGDSITVYSTRYVDWYFNGNYTNSGLSTDATQAGMYSWQDTCGFSSWFEVAHLTMDISISQYGQTLTANQDNGTEYQWVDCDINNWIGGANNQSFTPLNSGNYSVIVTFNGCVDQSECYHFGSLELSDLYKSNLSLSPNPADEKILINGLDEVTGLREVKVVSSIGKLEFKMVGTNNLLDISHLSPGVYFIRIFHEAGIETLKFIKK